MPFGTQPLAKEEIPAMIKSSLDNLKSLAEVNNSIITETQADLDWRLKDDLLKGKITKVQYNEQMPQLATELGLRLNAKESLDSKFARFEKLQQTEASSFIISEDTSRDELKKLIILLQIETINADKDKKLFLETILANAHACKTALDEGRPLTKVSVPILESELNYAEEIINLSKKEITLDKATTEVVDTYSKKLADLEATQAQVDKSSISAAEKMVINDLCRNVSNEVKYYLKTVVTEPDKIAVSEPLQNIERNISRHFDNAQKQADKIPITNGFKGFMNKVYSLFNKAPPYTIESTMVQDAKSKFGAIPPLVLPKNTPSNTNGVLTSSAGRDTMASARDNEKRQGQEQDIGQEIDAPKLN
ncbi:coiled coil protein [Legionella santicrucis]|uniref:Coiled coil protein n=1 Tax=Legionella santicrucis TaxID=45074 RepID=A0A0W0Y9I8_9GAMM|nr:hypothetical protein [Legionella santicrucis]KTD53514.1 coiled coil protein [Legionella santicrucis]